MTLKSLRPKLGHPLTIYSKQDKQDFYKKTIANERSLTYTRIQVEGNQIFFLHKEALKDKLQDYGA